MQRLAHPALAALAIPFLLGIALVSAGCGSTAPVTPAATPPSTRPATPSASPIASAPAAEAPVDGSGPPAATSPPAAATDPAAARVAGAIDAADLGDSATIDAVDAVRFTAGAAEAAAAAIANGATGDALWAATWIYASSGTDPAPLRPLLQQADPSVRAMAAAATLSLGDAAGATSLAGLLRTHEILRGSRPPKSVAAWAAGALARLIDGPALPAAADADAVASAWTDWLAAHLSEMAIDATTGVWGIP